MSAKDIKRINDATSTINPYLRKELLYSWEYGFIEDKPEEEGQRSPNLLRKDESRKSGKVLTNPLKRKVQSEAPHTVKTAAGAIFKKSDIAESKNDTGDLRDKSQKKVQSRRSPHGNEPKSRTRKKDGGTKKTNSESEEKPEIQERSEMENTAALYQDSQQNVTSKDIEVNGWLNFAIKRAKPNNADPVLGNASSSEPKGVRKKDKKRTCQGARKQKAAAAVSQKNKTDEHEETNKLSTTAKAYTVNTSTPRKEMKV